MELESYMRIFTLMTIIVVVVFISMVVVIVSKWVLEYFEHRKKQTKRLHTKEVEHNETI